MTDRRDRFCVAPDQVGAAVASLHLQSWADMKARLMVRTTTNRSGPLVRKLSEGLWLTIVLPLHLPGDGPTGDVEAMVTLKSQDVTAWATATEDIWSAAEANTRRSLQPMVRCLETCQFSITLLVGDRATSGVAIDIEHFARSSPPPPLPQTEPQPSWWSLLSERCAVLLRSNAAMSAHRKQDVESRRASAVVNELRKRTDGPFPPNLFQLRQPPSS